MRRLGEKFGYTLCPTSSSSLMHIVGGRSMYVWNMERRIFFTSKGKSQNENVDSIGQVEPNSQSLFSNDVSNKLLL